MNEVCELAPERRPQDCWDWIRPEDLTAMAMRAFERARRECNPPPGERFMQDGSSWSSRRTFLQTVAFLMDDQLKARAHSLGIDEFPQEVERVGRWWPEMREAANDAR